MRIAFLTQQFPHTRMGGIGAYTVSAAAALAAADVDAHIFTFTLPDDVRAKLPTLAPRVRVHEVADLAQRVAAGTLAAELSAAIQIGGDVTYRLAMAALLSDAALAAHAAMPFDVIEAPEYEALGVPLALRLANMAGGAAGEKWPALVTHLHSGSAINRRGNNLPTTAGDLAVDALELAAIQLADAVCAPSEAVVRETRVGLPFERAVEVIPLAVQREGAEGYTPPPANGPIVFVGRLERLKGADVLIHAANAFLSRCAEARIVIIGPDSPTAPANSGFQSMQQWMKSKLDAALHGRVEFTGELPPSEVSRYERAGSFVVVPSLFESFSLVAAGALAQGRPVIVSSGIGTTEVVGDAGMTFARGDAAALADAMEKLWGDAELLAELSKRAYARARERFDPAVVVPKRLAFYERVAAAAQGFDAATMDRRLAGIPAPFAGALVRPLVSLTEHLAGIRTGATLTPGQRLLEIMERLKKANGAPAQVLLYGAGRHSARVLAEKHLWESQGHRVVGFVDDAPRWNSGGAHLGLPVQTGSKILAQAIARQTLCPVVLSSDTFEDQFWEKTASLRGAGVRVLRLYGK